MGLFDYLCLIFFLFFFFILPLWVHSIKKKSAKSFDYIEEINALKEELSKSKMQIDSLNKVISSQNAEIDNLKTSLDLTKDELKELKQQRLIIIEQMLEQKIIEKIVDLRKRSQYESIPLFTHFAENTLDKKIFSAAKENMVIRNITVSANISSDSGNTYSTSLSSCSCKDFQIRKQPCKHMYRLGLELGLLASTQMKEYFELLKLIQDEKNNLEKIILSQKKEEEALKKERLALQETLFDFEKIKNETKQNSPWLSSLFADYFYLKDLRNAGMLLSKSSPAKKAAEILQNSAREKRILKQENKMLSYQLNFYDNLFPWLLDFKEVSPLEAAEIVNESVSQENSEYANLRKFLSPEEYNNLSSIEKFQLALDRYQNRNKTKWEVGIEYERYVGYLYETKGYVVTFTGATLGLEDMGRDLISKKDNSIIVIQCKRWAKEKTIHEKHIFQLYGSMVLLQLQNPEKESL
ncbi:MAG: restriction endonuclease [Anaerotignum sp.]|nr:restriction endonuclease [Anaerotignum sp.]